jgi:hypothetical protein
MTTRHPTIGGKGKPASVKPPKVAPVIPQLLCLCGEVHNIHLTPDTLQIIIPCKCGALLRYYPTMKMMTIEEVETC